MVARGSGSQRGPWDLRLEVVDILREPGCGWNYRVGFSTLWDGRHFPKGMCPFAWNAFAPWIWTLRYGGNSRALGLSDESEMTTVCPDPRHMVLWRIRRVGTPAQDQQSDPISPGIWKLGIQVAELPRGAGCEREYQVGDSWVYDGQGLSSFCPLAWDALSLWVWVLRYGGSPRAMEWPTEEVRYSCPVAKHPVVFRLWRLEECGRPLCGG